MRRIMEYRYTYAVNLTSHEVGDLLDVYKLAKAYKLEGLMLLCIGALERCMLGYSNEECEQLYLMMVGRSGIDELRNHILDLRFFY